MDEDQAKKRSKRSRFDGDEPAPLQPDSIVAAAAAAAARAAQISREITGKAAPSLPSADLLASKSRTAEMQASLAAQLASVSNLLSFIQDSKAAAEKKPAYRPLLLDAQGREIDEKGNLVKQEGQIKTLAANVAVGQAQKKKINPYLAHRAPSSGQIVPGLSNEAEAAPEGPTEIVDDRLILSNRERRGKKALSFAEAGKYIQQADELRIKEERKIIAGYTSGRKAPEVLGEPEEAAENDNGMEVTETSKQHVLPPPCDGGLVPAMEWWDEVFLPKTMRENRRRSRAAAEQDAFQHLNIAHVKTHKLVQHPVAVKALGGDRSDQPLPMFLTKKERKRIRKTAREEREREKRDKMMMGLIPAAEPKFKLSNFMKVLGDQAVADPSKVEMRVLQQMQQRQMNHEMRNQAAKLTPQERAQKKIRKAQEDTSRHVHVAAFRVADLSNPRHRFKVDVNAQQSFLTGTVLINQEACACNLVIVEGGPKGVRKFVKLMTRRIRWGEVIAQTEEWSGEGGGSAPPGTEAVAEEEDGGDSDADSEADEAEGGEDGGESADPAGGRREVLGSVDNKCALVWQGVVPKRTFTGFKFQECRTSVVCRKFLESKGVAHFWDMAFVNTSL